ncbi:flagellar hook-length control protein FliK [Vibrio agarivorans]|uniref:flagellar hook-length control protein FliK n=1 Tax=Vibrio agarivorans TaxID=153622 RepID=UPI0025B3DD8A|nr:flagellar hook-length control protein FliK [Vibrio agarivorans]MDN3662814.1 flagellar hook-length control protein FliK [Vibrio agarivorans]
MKLDLSTSTDSVKLTAPEAGKVSTPDNPSQENGFMSKLSAMLGNSSDSTDGVAKKNSAKASESKPVTSKADGEQDASSDAVKTSKAASSTGSASTDELQDDEVTPVKTTSTQRTASADSEVTSEGYQSTSPKERGNEGVVLADAKSQQAKKTVSESDELLERLNDSNNALQGKQAKPDTVVAEHAGPHNVSQASGGKALPPEEDQKQPAVKEAAAVASISNQVKTSELAETPSRAQSAVSSGIELETKQVNSSGTPSQEGAKAVSTGSTNESAAQDSELSNKLTNSDAQTVAEGELSQTSDELALKQAAAQAQETSEESVSVQVAAMTDSENPGVSPAQQDGFEPTQAKQSVKGEVNHEQVEEGAEAPIVAIPWGQSPKEDAQALTPVADGKAGVDSREKVDPAVLAARAAVVGAAANASSPQAAVSVPTSSVTASSIDNKAALDPALMGAMSASATPMTSKAASDAALRNSLAATGLVAAKADKQESSTVQTHDGVSPNSVTSAAATAQVTRSEVNTPQGSVVISQAMSAEQMAEKANERVQVMLSKNLKNIDIRLDPPELGRMQIRMNMNGDNATVHFTVANSQARDVIEQAMPRLREMLAQQGLQLGDTSVQQQSAGQQQGQFAGQGQSGAQGSGNGEGWDGDEHSADSSVNLNVKTEQDGISFYA